MASSLHNWAKNELEIFFHKLHLYLTKFHFDNIYDSNETIKNAGFDVQ